jgi:hypothetical protein
MDNNRELIQNFINNNIIIDKDNYISVNDFILELEIYFKEMNVEFNKYRSFQYICKLLSIKLEIENYKSERFLKKRVYKGINLKNNNNKILNKFIEIKEDELLSIIIQISEDIEIINNKLNLLYENKKRKIQIINKNKEKNIINSLKLKYTKDFKEYSLLDFIKEFIIYKEDIENNNILYISTIIEDYISYTNCEINKNTLYKILSKIIQENFKDIVKEKFYKDKKYYSNLIYV